MYTYKNIECRKMTEEDIINTSKLFSENYGVWSDKSKINPGKPVKFHPSRIKKDFVEKPDRYVSMVFHKNKLVGHAFYMRRTVQKNRKITWILQLVVDKSYRGNNIGTKLLHSIFGLSDSYACGLFTSNPMTIKALENATFRHVDVNRINRNISVVKEAAYDIFDDTDWIENYHDGAVYTDFYVDHSLLDSNIKKAYSNRKFPLNENLGEGYEWLAFTFKSQEPLIDNDQHLKILTEYSDDLIKSSYSHMNMTKQPWTLNAKKEVDIIIKNIGEYTRILDLGCGQGRHSNLLAERGCDVTGIDFSEENIKIAKEHNDFNVMYSVADARTYRAKEKFDVCLAMYDVIGSFPEEKENIKIIKNAYKNLKQDGLLIISVMNMELTHNRCSRAKNIFCGIEKNIDKLLKLEPSNTMQKTGDVFDGKKILIDDQTGVCYRKEQFFSESYLPEEYIVRDRRYTKKGIVRMLHREGFSAEDVYCFNAKDINKRLNPDDKKAKEIFVVARKKNSIYKLFQRIFNENIFWK